MKHFFMKTFHFTPKERNGTIAILLIAVLAVLWPMFYRNYMYEGQLKTIEMDEDLKQNLSIGLTGSDAPTHTDKTQRTLFYFDPNTITETDFRRLGLSDRTAKSICNYRNKGGRFRKAEDFKKIYTLSSEDFLRLLPYIRIEGQSQDSNQRAQNELGEDRSVASYQSFPFDPNTIDAAGMEQLGIPSWIAKRIINYRDKGGKFKKKEDLAKIYGFPEDLYLRLAPVIIINTPNNMVSAPAPMLYDAGAMTMPARSGKPMRKSPIDINRSSLEDWMTLPGIGETRARMIVKFREKLGGFLSVEQVAETKGLPDSVFQQIYGLLALQFKDLRKININAADQEMLDAHPYISSKQASLIFAYRDQNGSFRSVDDLLKLPAFFDRVWLEKVRPYLTLE